MTWTIHAAGHKDGDHAGDYAEVKEALRELVRRLREAGHTVNVHAVNDQDVEAQ
jgi:predicted amidohydrolase YtcJ